ncbi:Cyclic nucleotide-binding domain [Popillia japonica]|uniref:Cyclic nucleotide-binding domain n=1 Tax=Popillia japonica TaxID=7064 RepID=A0AAW1N550_POPJA
MISNMFGFSLKVDIYMHIMFEWHKRFSEGREEVEDDERPGRPVTVRSEENVQKVSEIMRKDRLLRIRMIGDMLNINKETIDPPSETQKDAAEGLGLTAGGDDVSSDDARTSLQSPRSQNTSREEDESSNANESDTKSPNQRTKSNQRWMKLRTTVQISSAMQKKPPLKREDSFLQRFSTRQIPETQETVEDTGSEGCAGDAQSTARRRRRTRKQPRTVVNPDENFYFYWLLILTICILYNMWTLIVRQSFPELQQLISNFWLACDSLSDVFFILDVCVQLRTGYLEQGLMVYDSKKLAKHYLTSRAFLLDLAALCPLDLLQLRFGPQPLLRWPRFFKVYRAVNYYYMVESRTVYPNLWRVINLIHILLILAHWFGCFYFLLSEAEGFQGDWVYPYRPGDYATLTRKYLGSLYWSTLTLTTIGDLPTPETNAERTNSVDGPRSLPRRGVKSRLLQFNNNGGYIFTIVSYLIGVFIFATIVGQVGNVITNRNANRLEFERLLDGAKTYMRHHKVPGGMKRRVLRWYDYSWSRGRIQGGGDINTALGLLPDKLKTELALHVNLSVLKKVTIFQECQPEFLRDLVLKMKAYIFTPGDSICRKGEVAREMFIIADGILEVLSETGKVLTSMKAGDFFGEIGILNLDGLNKRTADVRSVGYSELFSLSREDVLAAMKDYPEAQEILQALGRKRLMEVKASARHPPKDSKDHGAHASARHPPKDSKDHGAHGADPRGLVGKIKSEARGLRNALRKSRTHRRSQESLELQSFYRD